MKLSSLVSAAAFLALVGANAAFATDPTPAPAKPAAPAKVVLTCPVTGETIASVKDAVGSSVYKGKTYYFCCGGCKPSFDKNPAKYVKEAAKPEPKKTAVPVAKATPAAKV